MHALVINSDKAQADKLSNLLLSKAYCRTVTISEDPSIIQDTLLSHSVDLIFLKAKYWQHTLFGAAKGLPNPPLFIFLSAENEKFSWHMPALVPFHLQEPYTAKTIDRLFAKVNNNQSTNFDWDFLLIKHNRRYHKILFEDILLIEAKQNYLTIYTPYHSFMIAYSLNKMMQLLKEEDFCRVNKQFILPINAIRENAKKESWEYCNRIIYLSENGRREYQKKKNHQVKRLAS